MSIDVFFNDSYVSLDVKLLFLEQFTSVLLKLHLLL